MTDSNDRTNQSRREFIKTSAAVVGTTLAANLISIPGAYAAGSDEIRIGLIGCGGRGTGAAENAFTSAPGVKLVAMGDVFKDRLDGSRANLMKKHADKMSVKNEHCFSGFDAYEKVIATKEVNYIILATPPGFRPAHLRAAVEAGKNIFTEKPVAVDGAGIRNVLATYEMAKAKNLAIVAGTQRRHQAGYLETMKRIHDGAIGDLVAARCYWNQGGLWKKDRQEGWSDLEWQLRNWLYFTWLSGDHIVEQHVHNLDVVNWAMNGHPVSAMGMGGRQSRTEPAYGHIFDHFAIDYEYANGAHLMSMSRQVVGAANNVSEALVGTKGNCQVNRYQITGAKPWKLQREKDADPDPYVQEHTDLIASIRAGKPLNELKQVTESTLTAIMGRMSAYTGKVVTWEQALNSQENLVPAKFEWGTMPMPVVAVPGQTELM
jgi:myo-inositol 2-dehydrogenase / D-chiro-inositol 1-dehydrogenase